MIYGDDPKDSLGLNIYTPDINAIRQSSNLYVYCMNNAVMYVDPTGEIVPAVLAPVAAEVATAALEAAVTVGVQVAANFATSKIFSSSETASSRKLNSAMKSAGVQAPIYKYAAHHIVAGNDKRAEEARQILKLFEISINDAVNGVYLPTDKNTNTLAACHTSLHTNKYYQTVNERLQAATTKEEAIKILNTISEQLLNSTFLL